MKLLQKYFAAGAFLMSFAFGMVFWASNLQALSPMYTYQGVLEQTVACYQKMFDGSGMAQCGLNGCKFPSGIVCTPESCYDSAGATVKSPTWSEMLSKYDTVCLDSTGNPATMPPNPDFCSNEVAQVCGTDGVTYSNECFAKKAGVGIKYNGLCGAETDCRPEDDPVCGTDGTTYRNECEMNKLGLGLKVQFRGKCESVGGGDTCIKDMQNHLQNSRRDHQNRDREMRDVSRNNSGADVSIVKAPLDNWLKVLNEMEGLSKQSTNCNAFWDYQRDKEQDARWQVDDAFSKMYSAQQANDCKKQIAERKRFWDRDRGRMIEEQRGQGQDVTQLQAVVEKAKGMLNQLEQLLGSPTFNPQDCWNQLNEVNWLDRDFDDANQRLNEANWGKERIRQVKEKRNFLRDKERVIKDRQREGLEVTSLQSILKSIIGVIEKMEAMTSSGTGFDERAFQDLDFEHNDFDRDFWDANQALDQQRQGQECGRIAKEKQQQIKQARRECERAQCSKESMGLFQEVDNLIVAMSKAIDAKDFQRCWEMNGEIDSRMSEFWNSFQKVNERRDLERWLKDVEREVMKDRPRWVKDVCRENPSVCDRAHEYLKLMDAIYVNAKQAIADGDYQNARDLLNFEMQDVRMNMDDLMRSMQEGKERMFCKQEVDNMQNEIGRAAEFMQEMLEEGEIDDQRFNVCMSYVETGKSLVRKLMDSCERQDEGRMGDMWQEMDRLGQEVWRECPEMMQMDGPNTPPPAGLPRPMPTMPSGGQFGGPNFENFSQTFFEEEAIQQMANQIFEKVLPDVMRRVMDNMAPLTRVFEDMMATMSAKIASRFEEQIATTLESLTFVPEEFHEEILSDKKVLLSQVEELENTIAELEQKRIGLEDELHALQERMVSRNLIGNAADNIEEEVSRFMEEAPDLSKAELNEKLDELEARFDEAEEESLADKFDRGIVPFADTDDWQWFTLYAAQAKEEGFIKGTGDSGGSEFNPSGLSNLAEAVTMFGRVVGVDTAGTPTSAVCKRMPEWARPGCVALEKRDVNLDEIFGAKKSGDSVTRGEAARLLRLVFNLPKADLVRFNDNGSASEAERGAVSSIVAAGIAQGYDDDSGNYGYRDPLNRAALAKFIVKALELVQR